MASWDSYKVMRGDEVVVDSFKSREDAKKFIEKEKNNGGLYIVDVKGFIIYEQKYGAETLQRESTDYLRRTRAIAEQRRNDDSLLRKKVLQEFDSNRPRW